MTAVKHRPMSKILAPAPDPAPKTENVEPAPVEPTPVVAQEPAPVAAPSKYEGKTTDEVIEMHQNAEARLGTMSNELGTMRGLVSDLSQLNRTPVESQVAEEEPLDVSGDDLIQQPVETVRKIVARDNDKQKQIDDAEATLRQIGTEGKALVADFGNIDAIVDTEEFRNFALRTPTRQTDFQTAAHGDGLPQVRAARRLLEDYQDFQKAIAPTPIEEARAASTEGSGPAGAISSKPELFETEVVAMINSDPVKYRSPSFQAELASAIKEGRFVKAG